MPAASTTRVDSARKAPTTGGSTCTCWETDFESDPYVFGEGLDPRTYLDVDLSHDGRWLVVSAAIGTAPRDDVWIADRHAESLAFAEIQVGVDARCAASFAFDGRLYLWTDAGAPRGRLCVADPERPRDWSTLVEEDEEAVLGGYAVLDDEVLVSRARHAISEVVAISRTDGSLLREVPLPGVGSVHGITASPTGGTRAWISYTDALTPPAVLDQQGRLWAAAPGAVVLNGITASVEIATSADGTPVRLQILAPAGESGPLPTLLYGYGGFNISMEPSYSAAALAWVQSGGVWVVAQLRGGSEEGEAWHRAGMRGQKQNVFADFEAAARHLRASGRAGKLGIYGGSNGGLLVGAAVTREPALYDAVVCSAPLLDMVRYELFGLGGHVGTTSTAPRRTRRSSAGCSAIRRCTPSRKASRIPRCCSRSSIPTPGWTRSTAASSWPPCSGRRIQAVAVRCCCAVRPTSAMAGDRWTAQSG